MEGEKGRDGRGEKRRGGKMLLKPRQHFCVKRREVLWLFLSAFVSAFCVCRFCLSVRVSALTNVTTPQRP